MQFLHSLSRRRPVRDTMAIMSRLVRHRRADERIRAQAATIVRGSVPYDETERMRRIVAWVKDAMPFERDPRGVETINDPLLTVEKIAAYGEAAGDCDDAATAIATLAESLGIKTRFVAVSIRRDRMIHHVAVEAYDRRTGQWLYLDPYAPGELGGAAPKFTAQLREVV